MTSLTGAIAETGNRAGVVAIDLTEDQIAEIYTLDSIGRALRQGLVISGLREFEFIEATGVTVPHVHDFAVVASTDCDLDWDYKFRNKLHPKATADKEMPHILLHPAKIPAQLGSQVNSRISGNRDERYHFLQRGDKRLDSASEGVPELVIDFKHTFAVRTPEVYRQLDDAKTAVRRCRIVTPFREHLQNRFGSFHCRVALPSLHTSV